MRYARRLINNLHAEFLASQCSLSGLPIALIRKHIFEETRKELPTLSRPDLQIDLTRNYIVMSDILDEA